VITGIIIGVILGLGLDALIRHEIAMHRRLKAAQKALEARETPVVTEQRTESATTLSSGHHWTPPPIAPTPPAERFPGVGPTAIANREMYEREQKAKDSQPRFASPSVLNPSIADIEAASREATNGGGKH
jgi:hypothetical protein